MELIYISVRQCVVRSFPEISAGQGDHRLVLLVIFIRLFWEPITRECPKREWSLFLRRCKILSNRRQRQRSSPPLVGRRTTNPNQPLGASPHHSFQSDAIANNIHECENLKNVPKSCTMRESFIFDETASGMAQKSTLELQASLSHARLTR